VKWLICLAGGIASGKTTLAEALQAALPDSARLAFGDVVRSRARTMFADPTREQLQETGLQLISEGWPAFVGELLSELEGDPQFLIVEGVRHREAVQALRQRLRPRKTLVVFLDVRDDQRSGRLKQRSEAEHVLRHEVEQDVGSVRTIADLVLPSDQPVSELAAWVKRWLEGKEVNAKLAVYNKFARDVAINVLANLVAAAIIWLLAQWSGYVQKSRPLTLIALAILGFAILFVAGSVIEFFYRKLESEIDSSSTRRTVVVYRTLFILRTVNAVSGLGLIIFVIGTGIFALFV
jgi:adenylate kinase family enzyme